jgi:hypothetical protein
MNENQNFEKYQDFLNKKKFKLNPKNNNNINIEKKAKTSSNININKNNNKKNVIQSCISLIKEQMNNNKKNQKKIDINSKNKGLYDKNKNNLTEDNKINSYHQRYSELSHNFNKNKERALDKNRYYSNNSINPKINLRNNFSSEINPYNKEINHLLNSYDTKNMNESNKMDFRYLLSLVNELKSRNELLKKELRNKENLISLYEKNKINKKKIIKETDINSVLLTEYNNNILLDNDKLKSEILNLNKKLENQKIYYEDIINDYKNKLNEEKNKNNLVEKNYKEIENKYNNSNKRIINMDDDIKEIISKKAELEDINQKYEIINTNQQKRIEYLENQLNIVLTLIKRLFNKENELLYPMRNKLFYEIYKLNNE